MHVSRAQVWAVLIPVGLVFTCAGVLFVLERLRGAGGYAAF